MTQNNKQLSPELITLIEEYLLHFLKTRELYMKIEVKAIKEEGFTEDSIAILLDQRYKEAIKKSSTSTTNTTSITDKIAKTKSNNLYTHFQ